MAISDIIKYQKLDLTLYNLEKDYIQSTEIKRVYNCQNMYKARLDALVKLNKELEELYVQLTKLEAKFDEVDADKANYNVKFEEFTEIKEFEDYERNLAKYEENLINVNRDVSRIIKRISEINAENKKLNEQMDSLNNEYAKASNILSAKKKEMKKSAEPMLIQLNEMSKKIEESMLASYKELRNAKKMPAFVPYLEGNCCGCGMNISIEVDKKVVKSGDYAECPNCGRIVYKL